MKIQPGQSNGYMGWEVTGLQQICQFIPNDRTVTKVTLSMNPFLSFLVMRVIYISVQMGGSGSVWPP